ncbi:MAG: hypothetical protein ABEJ42_02470 [Halobacteriaceae archaeon]
MLEVRGHVGGTSLTGTLYERGESPPRFRGAPDDDAPYAWLCDAFYEVDSGGTVQQVDGRRVHVAFENPAPRGFETREAALAAAREHVRTQFARLGVDRDDVDVEVASVSPAAVGNS